MENEFSRILKSEIEGLETVDYFHSYEEMIGKYGFTHLTTHCLKNIKGDDAYITIFAKMDYKAVKVAIEVETQSEGTLTYQTYYASSEIKELFKNPYK